MHWITLWGYDKRKQFFYVYDSGLPKNYWNKKLPIGNTMRTYKEVLIDWNIGKWQFWCRYSGIGSHSYISIKNKLKNSVS